ncbi:MAG TPA: hypothetical protein VK936_10690 [Longimicrobiales bacterium]|nr:hypothetical protein [Longimicrobiales bacterium]
MTFDEFEAAARDEWDRIPAEYRDGVDGLVVERAARPHPELPDVYTMGECVTEAYPSAFGDADTIRSLVVLYYGSFFRLSRIDTDFDWRGELWETLTHELQHHLESLAADDALVGMDYAADENFKRYEGEAFDPLFFRQGVPEDGWTRVDDEYFREYSPADGPLLHFEWRGGRYVADAPEPGAEVTFCTVVDGVADPPSALVLVVVVRRGLLASLQGLLRGGAARVADIDVAARPAGGLA